MVIREAESADAAAILTVYRASGIEGKDAFSVDEAVAQLKVIRAYPNYRVFVAVVEGSAVGTYSLLIMDNMAKRGRRSGVVEGVAVMPDYQGRGIGRAMMEHALEQCRLAECYKLALSSNRRRVEAHEFYQSLGFKRHGYSFVVPVD